MPRRTSIAHRGASAYAPEHTLEAYRMALEQGADFLEPDLQITRDGILVALHDVTLERTTDVRTVFPDRGREEVLDGRAVVRWHACDFTFEEIQRLDAGAWFHERFRGARIPAFAELITLARGRAGVFPETKAPEVYGSQGLDMERLLVAELDRHGLLDREGAGHTPVMIQSFSRESLGVLREALGSEPPLILLVPYPDPEGLLTPEGLRRTGASLDGIGPDKRLLTERPSAVAQAHDLGMMVVPWTFREGDSGAFPDVTSEMAHFLYELGVDGLFTDNPDRFPREPPEPVP